MPRSAEPAAAAPSRAQRHVLYGAIGALAALLLFAIPTTHAPPVRDLWVEAKTFALCYLVLQLVLWRLVRHLPHRLWQYAVFLFYAALTTRLIVLVLSVEYAVTHGFTPGVLGIDNFIWSQRSRAIAMVLTGETYGLIRDINIYTQYHSVIIGTNVWTGYFHYSSFNGLIVALCGFSALAHSLPTVTIAVLLPVTILCVGRVLFPPAFAVGAALWATFAPGYIFYGTISFKDTAVALLFVSVLGLVMRPWRLTAWRFWLPVVLVVIVAIAIRDNLYLAMAGFIFLGALNWRLPRRWRWISWTLALLGGVAGSGSPTRGVLAWVLNYLAVPALSWLFTPVGALEIGWLAAMPYAPFWPLIVFIGLAGVITGWARVPETLRLLLPMSLAYLSLVASEYLGGMTVVRLRLMVEWVIGGLFFWTLHLWRTSSPAARARSQQLALLGAVLLYTAFLLYAAYNLLR